jgi:hypothetical protein
MNKLKLDSKESIKFPKISELPGYDEKATEEYLNDHPSIENEIKTDDLSIETKNKLSEVFNGKPIEGNPLSDETKAGLSKVVGIKKPLTITDSKSGKMKYYHVTDFEGWVGIHKDGIKCDSNGDIFVLNKKEVVGYVALNQLGLQDYGLFEIDSKGISGNVAADNVGEITAKYQFMIHQPIIERKFIKGIGMFNVKAS